MSTENTRNRIVVFALKAFQVRGIRGVTMDDVSRGLQISKRTLYQIFETKEDLLLACIKYASAKSRQRAASMLGEGLNVLEVILGECQARLEESHGFTREFAIEVKRYPLVWQYVNRETERQRNLMEEFLQRGVNEGVFLPGINYRLVFASMQRLMEYSITGEDFVGLSDEVCFFYSVFIMLRGCATPKGVALIDDFLAKHKTKASIMPRQRQKDKLISEQI